MPERESIEWCDIWITAGSEATLPRVLLIGDSVARSYHGVVERALQGVAHVARIASSKCLCDPGFLPELAPVLKDYAFAVIHFNNGLHGWGYTEDAYREHFSATVRYLRDHGRGATLIWASTTPMWSDAAAGELRPDTERVRARNRIAEEAARADDIVVNDFFAATVDRPRLFVGDGVHLNEEGQDLLGQMAAKAIRGNWDLSATGQDFTTERTEVTEQLQERQYVVTGRRQDPEQRTIVSLLVS